MKELIETTLEEARQTLESFLEETTTVGIISQAASTCAEALKAGNKIISCGNGGSLCDATHFAEDYRTLPQQPHPATGNCNQ